MERIPIGYCSEQTAATMLGLSDVVIRHLMVEGVLEAIFDIGTNKWFYNKESIEHLLGCERHMCMSKTTLNDIKGFQYAYDSTDTNVNLPKELLHVKAGVPSVVFEGREYVAKEDYELIHDCLKSLAKNCSSVLLEDIVEVDIHGTKSSAFVFSEEVPALQPGMHIYFVVREDNV